MYKFVIIYLDFNSVSKMQVENTSSVTLLLWFTASAAFGLGVFGQDTFSDKITHPEITPFTQGQNDSGLATDLDMLFLKNARTSTEPANVKSAVAHPSGLPEALTSEVANGNSTDIWVTPDVVFNLTENPLEGVTSRRPSVNTIWPESTKTIARVIYNYIQVGLGAIGTGSNIVTLVALVKRGETFALPIRTLLIHQAILDGLVSCLGAIQLVQPYTFKGDRWYHIIICHLYFSQFIYWYLFSGSVCNLVAITTERYLAVCRPFHHQIFRRQLLRRMNFSIHALAFVANVPTIFFMSVQDGKCLFHYSFQDVLSLKYLGVGYAIGFLVVFYLIPCVVFLVLYTLVIQTLRRRLTQNELSCPALFGQAATQITRCAIAVTAIFVVAVGVDQLSYLLTMMNVTSWLSSNLPSFVMLYSCSNPIIYLMAMPMFRACVMRTFGCSRRESRN